jgi:2-polyprenyl-6-methoxyphenol hydroxylase-like FAD-dependent oxidoreductase
MTDNNGRTGTPSVVDARPPAIAAEHAQNPDNAHQTRHTRQRAIVLGASMGGLLAARVLADFYRTVTVVERDVLPTDAVNRRGVPQGSQIHALAARGSQILDELFPGFLGELVGGGAPIWNDGDYSKLCISIGGHQLVRSGSSPKPQSMSICFPSRPFLERNVRQRVRAIPNVTILEAMTC